MVDIEGGGGDGTDALSGGGGPPACRRTDRMEAHSPHGGCSGFGMHARGAREAGTGGPAHDGLPGHNVFRCSHPVCRADAAAAAAESGVEERVDTVTGTVLRVAEDDRLVFGDRRVTDRVELHTVDVQGAGPPSGG